MKRIVVAFSALLLLGCTSMATYQAYPGTVPEAARARLLGGEIPKRESCEPKGPLILFSAVDGKVTDDYYGGYDNGCRFPNDALLLPGEHTIEVYYSEGSSPSFHNFCFVAEAGKTYQAERAVDGYKVSFSAVETGPSGRVPAKSCAVK